MSSRALPAVCLAIAVSVLATRAEGVDKPKPGGLIFRTTTFNNGLGFGARAMGMAGAFTAIADDASAASWNPAGLGQLIRPEITVVGGYNKATSSTTNQSDQFFDDQGTSQLFLRASDRTADLNSYGVDFISFAQPFKLGRQLFTTQISYSRNARPLNASESYKTDFFDRPGAGATDFGPDFLDSKASSFGGYDSIGLGFGTGFDERLYIGFTVNYWTGSTSTSTDTQFRSLGNLSNGTQLVFSDYRVETFDEQTYSGLSASVGILIKPSSKVSIGLTYRGGWAGSNVTSSKLNVSGTQRFDVTTGNTTSSQLLPIRARGEQTSNGTLSWPGTIGGGVAWRPIEALTVALDASLTQWPRSSSTRIPIANFGTGCTVANNVATCPVTYTEESRPFPSQTDNPFIDQNNQTAYRLGLEYVLRPGNVSIPIRAGIYRIRTIAPLFDDGTDGDPDVNFNGITAGIGLALPFGNGSLLFDAAGVFDKATTNRNADLLDANTLFQRTTGDREVKNSRFIASIIYRY